MPKPRKIRHRAANRRGERVKILISGRRIQRRIQALAKQIRRDFPDEPLHLVSVLKGGVFFLTDLARSIAGEVSFDFIAVSSYGKATRSSGQVRLTRDLDSSIEGKAVILVEDILDTGMTLQYLLKLFQHRKPKHLRVAVLLDKPDRRIAPVRCGDRACPTTPRRAGASACDAGTALGGTATSSRYPGCLPRGLQLSLQCWSPGPASIALVPKSA